jgi:hypothetical protein
LALSSISLRQLYDNIKQRFGVLTATPEEIERVRNHMKSQAPDLTVEFVQKVYSENVLNIRHDVWDVHTNVDRWWSSPSR